MNASISITIRQMFESMPEQEGNRFMRDVFAFLFDNKLPEVETEMFAQAKKEILRKRSIAESTARWRRTKADPVIQSAVPSLQPSAVPPAPQSDAVARMFEEFKKIYPKKSGFGLAMQSIRNARLRENGRGISTEIFCEKVLAATRKYAECVATWPQDEKHFAWNPQIFFDAEHFNDDPGCWKWCKEIGDDGLPKGELLSPYIRKEYV